MSEIDPAYHAFTKGEHFAGDDPDVELRDWILQHEARPCLILRGVGVEVVAVPPNGPCLKNSPTHFSGFILLVSFFS
jgi:hypothetical protein